MANNDSEVTIDVGRGRGYVHTGPSSTLPDTNIEWYDFGNGAFVTEDQTDNKDEISGPNMAALCCVRSGKFYYRIFTGAFTTEKELAVMRAEHEPAFVESLPKEAHEQ